MLCSSCKAIDLEALSQPAGYRLGKSFNGLDYISCKLCGLFYSAFGNTIERHSLPFALHGKRHNPNYPDADGIAEIEVRQYVPEGKTYFGGMGHEFCVPLGVAVDSSKLPVHNGRVPFVNLGGSRRRSG